MDKNDRVRPIRPRDRAITYAELGAAIAAMSPEQLQRPVEAYEFAGRAYAITRVFGVSLKVPMIVFAVRLRGRTRFA